MFETFNVEALLTLKDQMSKGLVSAAKNAQGMESSFMGVVKTGAAMQVGMKAAGMAMGALSSNMGAAISRYDQLNQFPKLMKNLGFSTKEASEAQQDLVEGIQHLPMSLDQATAGVTRFVSKNNDLKKSTNYFLAVSDAIAAGGQSAGIQQSAIEQLSQSYSKGKMDMMEWRSLQQAMPAQLNQIAKAMGMTTDALGEGLRNGTVSMDEFMDTIVKLDDEGVDGLASFRDQARTACDGIALQMSNLKIAITAGMAGSIAAIDEALKKNKLPTIAQAIEKAKNKISDAFDVINAAIKKIDFKGIVEGLKPWANALMKVGKAAGKAGGGILKFANAHAETIAKVLPGIYLAVRAFKLWGPTVGIIDRLKDRFRILPSSAEPAEKAVETFGQAMGKVAKMAGVALIIASLALLAKSLEGLASLGSTAVTPLLAFGVVVGGLAAIFSKVGPELQKSAIGIAVFAAAVAVVALAMAPLAKTGTEGAIAMVAFALSMGALAAIMSAVGEGLTLASLGMVAFGAMVLMVGAGIGIAVNALANLVNSIANLAQQLPIAAEYGVKGALGLAAMALSATALAAASSLLALALAPLIVAALGAGVGLLALGVGFTLAAAGCGVLKLGLMTVNSTLKSMAKNATTTATTLAQMVGSINIVKSGLSALGGAATAFVNGFKSKLSTAVNAAKSTSKAIVSALKSASSGAYNTGVYIGQGLASGMWSQVGIVRAAATALAAEADKAVRAKAKIASPSRVMKENGGWIGEGLAIGIEDKAKRVKNAFDGLVSPILPSSNLAFAGGYNMNLSDDYDYNSTANYTVTVPVELDGKVIAEVTARPMRKELNKIDKQESRAKGRI